MLFVGADLYGVPNILHQFRQMHRLCLQRNLSILNAAHIQHIVDKGQKMLAGNGYLFQIVLYLVTVVDVRLRQSGETDDGIHGRSDVVRHIKQELPLGEIGLGFTLNGKLECGVFLFERLLVFLLGVLLLHKEILCGVPAESLHKRQNQDIHDQRDHQIHHGEVIDLTGGNIGIEGIVPPMAVHSIALLNALRSVHADQFICPVASPDRHEPFTLENVHTNQSGVVGGRYPVLLHHQKSPRGVDPIAVYQRLDGQNGLLGKLRPGIAVGQHRTRAVSAAVHSNIGKTAIVQLHMLDIGLLRVADDTEDRFQFDARLKLCVADAILRVLTYQLALRVQQADARKPQPLGALRQRRLITVEGERLQRADGGGLAHKALRDGGFVVLRIVSGLLLDKLDRSRQPLLAILHIRLSGKRENDSEEENTHSNTNEPEFFAENGLQRITVQGTPPPNRFRDAPDTCRRSPAWSRPDASVQRCPSAPVQDRGHHRRKRLRRFR